MYAIIETGGKQYRVSEGDVILVEKLVAEAGETLHVDRVLALMGETETRIGTPTVTGARVLLKVIAQEKGPKVLVFKYKAKKNYRRRQGHRQPLTRALVEKIEG